MNLARTNIVMFAATAAFVLAVTGATAGPPPLAPAQAAVQEKARGAVYYIAPGRKQEGPYSKDVIVQRIKAGKLTPDTLAWREGMDTWRPIGQFPEFSGMFDAGSATSQPSAGLPAGEAALRRFMVGKWREVESHSGTVKVVMEMIFDPDGTTQYIEKEVTNGQVTDQNAFAAFWRIIPINSRQFKLLIGSTPGGALQEEDIFTAVLTYMDHDHLRDPDGMIMERVK